MQKEKTKITGTLAVFYEAGMTSAAWTLDEDNPAAGTTAPYDIKNGDMLAVFAGAADEIWSGVVNLDPDVKAVEIPSGNPDRPHIFRCDSGFQKDMASAWADMFFKRRRATVIPANPHP